MGLFSEKKVVDACLTHRSLQVVQTSSFVRLVGKVCGVEEELLVVFERGYIQEDVKR